MSNPDPTKDYSDYQCVDCGHLIDEHKKAGQCCHACCTCKGFN